MASGGFATAHDVVAGARTHARHLHQHARWEVRMRQIDPRVNAQRVGGHTERGGGGDESLDSGEATEGALAFGGRRLAKFRLDESPQLGQRLDAPLVEEVTPAAQQRVRST